MPIKSIRKEINMRTETRKRKKWREDKVERQKAKWVGLRRKCRKS